MAAAPTGKAATPTPIPPCPILAFGAQVYWCCCFPQGPVTLDFRYVERTYAAGELVTIPCDIHNDSSCDISDMVVSLHRFVTLKDDYGHRVKSTACLAEEAYEGVARNSTAARVLELHLPEPEHSFVPSTDSDHISIRYELRLEARIPLAFSVSVAEIHLPTP